MGLHHDAWVCLFIAYTMGELYCRMINWLLSTPETFRSFVDAELAVCGPGQFWLRLRRHCGISFSLGLAEVEVLRKRIWPWWSAQGIKAPSMPKHIIRIYLSDKREFIHWDGNAHPLQVSQ